MNMMYPRLFLARNLLREDGVIFISIDDNEVDNLNKLCKEIFGEENFIATVVWQRAFSPKNDAKYLSENHDYILIYGKAIDFFNAGRLERTEEANERYSNPDKDPRGDWVSGDLTVKTYSEKYDYPITTPGGREVHPAHGSCWRVSKEKLQELTEDNRIWFGIDGNNVPRLKRFLSEVQDGMVPTTLWLHQEAGHNQEGRQELKELFDDKGFFDGPKPVRLLDRIMKVSNLENGDVILDFFAGSATTAHAVLDLNKEDGGNRKFIMVQLPEPTEENSEVYKAGYKTIADIGKERIRRVIKKTKGEQDKKKDMFSGDKQQPDLGFKVFKLQPSNFKLWDGDVAKDEEAIKKQIELFVEHINPQSSQEDILYEILLKSGFPLTTKIEKTVLAERYVFSIADGSMLICLEKDLTPEVIKEMAEMKPVRVVCLDEGFKGNDQLKTNAVQIMKTRNITFRTV